MSNGSSDVNYTVKELLARVDVKLDRIEEAVRGSATRDELMKVSDRVEKLERAALERGGEFQMSRKVFVALGGVAFFLYNVGTLAFLIGSHRL